MKNIVIWGYTGYKWLSVPLAKEIKRKHQAKVHFICTNAQSIEYWKRHDPEGIIDSFVTIGHFFFEYDQCGDGSDEIYAHARELEHIYGVYVVDVLQTDRHLGRGFFAGGIGHPRSHMSEKADYMKSVNFFNRAFKFWEEYFDRTQPDLVIGLSSSIVGKICTVVARHRTVPVRTLFLAGYQSYHGWATDEYFSLSGIRKNFETITDCNSWVVKDELAGLRRLPVSNAYNHEVLNYRTIRFVFKKMFRQCRSYISRKRHRIITMGNYKLLEQLRYLYHVRHDVRLFDKLSLTNPNALIGKSYVFFPLHVEPESSVGMQSPEFNDQFALVEFIAKNLPAGTVLVVKEHIAAIGRRPKEFYTTILDIPNVVMVFPFTYALDIARGAKAVATITGTLGMEAAVLGIPVISFGLHNNYNILPHVYTVESWTALRPLLTQLCGKDSEEAQNKRKEDGRRYLAAVKKACIDLSWIDYASKDRPSASEKEVQVIYDSLMKSLV